ncbi:hypothetical protein EV421DRAFT_1715813, partial [Armillaria borealis]
VPVPKVWMQFRWGNATTLLLKRVPGQCLAEVWSDLPHEPKQIIMEQPEQYIREIRSIPSPSDTRICSVLGGHIRNYRMHDNGDTCPFRDEVHPNMQLRLQHSVQECAPIVSIAHTKSHPVIFTHTKFCSLVFTHGDLIARDIIVHGTRVTSIVNWECAGWFPGHVEYCA